MGPSKNKIKQMVRERYASIVQSDKCRCCGDSSNFANILDLGRKLDYTNDELAIGLGDANLGLGCGNPLTIADLKPGETVLDLGSGAGFESITITKKNNSEQIIRSWNLGKGTEFMVFSAYIQAGKP